MVLFRKHLNKQKQLVYFCLGLKLVWQILSSLRAEATFYLVKSLSPYPCPHHLAIYSTQQALSIQYKHWKYVSLWMIQKIFSALCKVDFDCLTLITDFFFFFICIYAVRPNFSWFVGFYNVHQFNNSDSFLCPLEFTYLL